MPKSTKRTLNDPHEETFAERAVKKYRESEQELAAFMQEPDVKLVLLQYHDLIQRRNEELDEAIRSVKSELQRSERDRLFIDGIGAQKKIHTYYDVDYLRAYLPPDQLQLVVTERTVYDLHVEDLVRLVRQGEIDENIVRQAHKEETQNPASLPGTPKPWSVPTIAAEEDHA